jgi:hypothetical protein
MGAGALTYPAASHTLLMSNIDDYDDPDPSPWWLRRTFVELVALAAVCFATVIVLCVVVPRFFPWLILD